MNLWNEFVTLNDIQKRFEDPDPSKLEENLKNIGKKWMENPESLILTGLPGRGKTYFTMCLLRVLIERIGMADLLFRTSRQIDDEIIHSIHEYGSASEVIKKYKKISYLFIDDFGIDRATDRSERDYYELINYRWAGVRTTVISTNLDSGQIDSMYGARILSRLKNFQWVLFEGPDLRQVENDRKGQ